MKKLLLPLLLSGALNAQIKQIELPKCENIGKITPMGMTYVELEKCGELYNFRYRDTKFTQISEYKTFSFGNEYDELNTLYNTIIKGLENPPTEEVVLELPNDVLHLRFGKMMGITAVNIYHAVNKNPKVLGSVQALTRKQVDKLFGKSK